MARLKVKRLFITVLILFLMLFISIYLLSFNNSQFEKHLANLEPAQTILDRTQVTISPSFYTNTIQFEISCQSFENPEFLTLDFSKHFLIYCDSFPLQNINWKVLKNQKNTVKGLLTADMTTSEYAKLCFPLKLELFLDQSSEFIWTEVNSKPLIINPY